MKHVDVPQQLTMNGAKIDEANGLYTKLSFVPEGIAATKLHKEGFPVYANTRKEHVYIIRNEDSWYCGRYHYVGDKRKDWKDYYVSDNKALVGSTWEAMLTQSGERKAHASKATIGAVGEANKTEATALAEKAEDTAKDDDFFMKSITITGSKFDAVNGTFVPVKSFTNDKINSPDDGQPMWQHTRNRNIFIFCEIGTWCICTYKPATKGGTDYYFSEHAFPSWKWKVWDTGMIDRSLRVEFADSDKAIAKRPSASPERTRVCSSTRACMQHTHTARTAR